MRACELQHIFCYIRIHTGIFCLFREPFSKKQDNKKLPEPKAIDEPVYINIEVQYPHSVGF